jgi:plastocyanin
MTSSIRSNPLPFALCPLPFPWRALAIIGLLVAATACGDGSAEPPKPTAAAGKKVDAATAGSIAGMVKFEGTAPANAPIRISKDCPQVAGAAPVNEAVLVGKDGALRNVFVYVKSGLDAAYTFDTPTAPVELVQSGCIYAPRVMGVRVGQPIDVVNSDPTLHNVHALPMVNQEFNKSQPVQNSHMTHVFTAPEVMVRFMCNVHSWMSSYVGVMEHPYFAVSDEAGHFEIKNLPPGTYTLEAWHEKFGRKTAQVTVGDKQAQTATFTFAADSKSESK